MNVVLPDRAIWLLRQLTDDSDRAQWALGDISAELVDELGSEYGKGPVRQRIAIEAGIAPETVRDREGMARFFTVDVRQKYGALSYHQLRACKGAGSEWQKYADWALESADEYGGRLAPVAAIRAMVKHGPDQTPAWVHRWERWLDLLEILLNDDQMPYKTPLRVLREFISWLGLG